MPPFICSTGSEYLTWHLWFGLRQREAIFFPVFLNTSATKKLKISILLQMWEALFSGFAVFTHHDGKHRVAISGDVH